MNLLITIGLVGIGLYVCMWVISGLFWAVFFIAKAFLQPFASLWKSLCSIPVYDLGNQITSAWTRWVKHG